MKFGLLYELQLPRPWGPDAEYKLVQNAIEQVELADRVGATSAWAVEHHFLEEYAHSSAPEVFLAACSQRTKNIRLGHGIVALPPAMNPTFRVAERIGMLDLVSGGRVEFGTGETSSNAEIEAFHVPRAEKRAMWREALEVVVRMMVEEPFQGHNGKYIQAPVRNVIPKPRQKPHPPLWVACSQLDMIRVAAKLGIGALTFGFVSPEEARQYTEEYYRIIETECEPVGYTVNANIAFTMFYLCDRNGDRAREIGRDGAGFFFQSFGHHYLFGEHEPGKTSIYDNYKKTGAPAPAQQDGFGTPDEIRSYLAQWEETGVDQILLLAQNGNVPHDAICSSHEMFFTQVAPEYHEREEKRQKEKAERLAPAIERALKRKKQIEAPKEKTIVKAYGKFGIFSVEPAGTSGS
jgi:alkanesulfonate monooxygenase SsuD/methylene tetrahydromethanopterin reductase-like flavin-dependent oxidoreductase (luciferase family)